MDTATQRRLALLEAEVATLRRQRARRSNWRKRLPLALVALLVALVPLGIAAAGPTFSDLNEAAPVHQANIQAIGDAGITTGFEDTANPGQRTYNPKGLVTREEMASFLARTAGLGSNAPVANAKTAQTATNATHANSADTATTAAQLNGQAASFYQPAGQPIANATTGQTLQGYAPSGLVRVARGSGFVGSSLFLTVDYQTIAAVTLTAPSPGFVLVQGTATTIKDGPPCFARTRLRDTAAAPETASPYAYTYTSSTTGVGNYIPVSPTWVFPVATGGRTFVLEAQLADNFSSCYAEQGMITALFVPFGYNGGTTVAP